MVGPVKTHFELHKQLRCLCTTFPLHGDPNFPCLLWDGAALRPGFGLFVIPHVYLPGKLMLPLPFPPSPALTESVGNLAHALRQWAEPPAAESSSLAAVLGRQPPRACLCGLCGFLGTASPQCPATTAAA